MNGIHLTAKEQQLLEQTLHTTHDARLYRRTLALLECSRGRQVKDVAQALGVTRQSVHNGSVRFQQQHSALALTDGPRPGRPHHADDRVETLLRAYWRFRLNVAVIKQSIGQRRCCAIRCARICRWSVVTSRCVFA